MLSFFFFFCYCSFPNRTIGVRKKNKQTKKHLNQTTFTPTCLLKKKSPSKCILPMKEIYSPNRSCALNWKVDFPLQVFELNTRDLVDQEGLTNVLPLKKKRKDSSYVFSVLDIFAFILRSHASPQSPPPPLYYRY